MNRDRGEIIYFIKRKVKENHGHIGMFHEIKYVDYDISTKDINIYLNGTINCYRQRTNGAIWYYMGNTLLECNSIEFLNAVYNEIVNDRYL